MELNYSSLLISIPNSIYDSAANWNKVPGHGDITKECKDQYGDDHNSAHDPVNSGQEAAHNNPRHVAIRMCLVSIRLYLNFILLDLSLWFFMYIHLSSQVQTPPTTLQDEMPHGPKSPRMSMVAKLNCNSTIL